MTQDHFQVISISMIYKNWIRYQS